MHAAGAPAGLRARLQRGMTLQPPRRASARRCSAICTLQAHRLGTARRCSAVCTLQAYRWGFARGCNVVCTLQAPRRSSARRCSAICTLQAYPRGFARGCNVVCALQAPRLCSTHRHVHSSRTESGLSAWTVLILSTACPFPLSENVLHNPPQSPPFRLPVIKNARRGNI